MRIANRMGRANAIIGRAIFVMLVFVIMFMTILLLHLTAANEPHRALPVLWLQHPEKGSVSRAPGRCVDNRTAPGPVDG